MANDLKIEKLVEGNGATPKQGQSVTVHYTGCFLDGKKFDSSVDRGEPFSFVLGAGQVISGWDVGVATMRVGDKVKLTLPPGTRLWTRRLSGRDPTELDSHLRGGAPCRRLDRATSGEIHRAS